MTNSLNRKDKISMYFFVIEIIVMFIMSSFFIPTVDDLLFSFRFPYSNFKEFINYTAYYGNGRLLGNGLLLFFCNHAQLFYALQTVLTAIFAITVEKIVNLKYARHYVIAYFILQPFPVLSTTFSWMSSFINYYIPIILMCITTYIILKIKSGKIKSNFLLYPLLVLLGFTQQLFMETNSVINTIISFCFIILFIKTSKRITYPLTLFISNVVGLGTILLFTKFIDINKTYVHSLYGSENYRNTIFSGGITNAVEIVVKNFRYPVFLLSVFIFFFISWTLIVIYTAKKKNIFNAKVKATLALSILFYIPLCIITQYILVKYPVDLPSDKKFLILIGVIVILFLASYMPLIILLFTIVIKSISKKAITIFLILMGIISYAPFLVVSPSGFRCYELSLFFFMLGYLIILKDLKNLYGFDVFKLNMVCSIITTIIMLSYSFIFAHEKKIYNYKIQYFDSMEYLPHSNDVIVMHGDNEGVWDSAAGFEHKYIPIDEFEDMILQNKNK